MNKMQLEWHAPKFVRLVDAPEKNCTIITEIDAGTFGYNGTVHLSDPTQNGGRNDWCDGLLHSSYRFHSMYMSFGVRENNREADGPS